VTLFSRIRVARNLDGYPFANRLSTQRQRDLARVVLDKSSGSHIWDDLQPIPVEEMDFTELEFLVERKLIQPGLLERTSHFSVLASPDDRLSITINEDDHLRFQLLKSGDDAPEDGWGLLEELVQAGSRVFDYSRSEQLGFLTASPNFVGTGMRGTVTLHLPALAYSGRLRRMEEQIRPQSVTLRPVYGGWDTAYGDLFEISNTVTLGISEAVILKKLRTVTDNLVEEELRVRARILREYPYQLEDRIRRALGVLTHSRLLSQEEFLDLFSSLLLGMDVGILQYEGETAELHSMWVTSGYVHRKQALKRRGDNLRINAERSRWAAEKLRKVRLAG